jgi:hypothetical protein
MPGARCFSYSLGLIIIGSLLGESINSEYEEEFHRQDLVRFGFHRRDVYLELRHRGEDEANARTDAKRAGQPVDCATGTQFRKRSVYPVVDRWETSRRYSAKPALWRNSLSRTPHVDRARPAKYAVASANVDPAHGASRPRLHLYRDLAIRSACPPAVELLQPDHARQRAVS